MRLVAPEEAPPLARWTTRMAVFSLGLIVAGIFLHRLFDMRTPVVLNLFELAFVGACLALILAMAASARIWQNGGPGAARVLAGSLLALGILAWPLAYVPTIVALPMINDVSTDTRNPPRFVALARQRGPGANNTEYPGEVFAKLQAAAYPDLQPITLGRSTTEAFELAADTLRNKLGYRIVREQPPGSGEDTGLIEAVDQTLIIGFRDDIAVRVIGESGRAKIDIRSASRYGRHDLGHNADRVRHILKELATQIESTAPAATEHVTLKSRDERAVLKQQKQKDGRRKKPRDRAQ